MLHGYLSHHGDGGTSEAEAQAEECPPQDQRHRQATEDPERGPTPWGTFHDHEADGPEQHDREEGGAAHLVAVAVRPEVGVEGECKQEAPQADEPDDAEQVGCNNAEDPKLAVRCS